VNSNVRGKPRSCDRSDKIDCVERLRARPRETRDMAARSKATALAHRNKPLQLGP
jgi:hypothetical protein